MESIDKPSRQTATLMKTLDIGSGVDIDSLARSLADAETATRVNTTKTRMSAVENRLSGYSVVASFLSDFKQRFDTLQNVSELFATTVGSSDSARVPVSLSGNASAGQYKLSVHSIASATVIQSAQFSSSDSALNNGSPFELALQIGGAPALTITVSDDTPLGVVNAINTANLGVRATLLNKSASGNDWQIVLQGRNGEAADFSVTNTTASEALGFDLPENRLATAQDAHISINGLTGIKRSSNSFSDVIPGVTINLNAHPGTDVAILVERSSAPIKQKLQFVVEAYNEFNAVLDELARQPSAGSDQFTGSLLRDKQFLATIRGQIKALILQESSTPAGGYRSLRDLGINFELDGTAKINQQQLDVALATDDNAVAMMLSAGTDGTSIFSLQPKGLAQDISVKLAEMLSASGIVNQRKTSANSRISVYKRDLEKLEVRLEAIYKRYLSQFAAMESLVQRMEGIGSYLKGQFSAMENMYKK